MTGVSVHDILVRPVISEKSVAQTERNNYTFVVGRDANKLQINATQNVFARYAWDKELTFCETCGGRNAAFNGFDTHSPRDSMLVAHTWAVSPRLLNELRSQIPPSQQLH